MNFEIEFEEEKYQVSIVNFGDQVKTIISYHGHVITYELKSIQDPDTLQLMISSFWSGYHFLRIGNRPEIHC